MLEKKYDAVELQAQTCNVKIRSLRKPGTACEEELCYSSKLIVCRHSPDLPYITSLPLLSQAVASKAPLVDVERLSESQVRSLTGNAMSVPCAGLLVLVAAIFTQKI